jgi:CMP/dCMP kinase
MSGPIVIAIDGPAGAGKSTVARKLAERLGLGYVDSGATYRAAALCVLDRRIPLDDERGVASAVAQAAIEFTSCSQKSRVLLDGRDVTDRIRTPEVTRAAAFISRLPAVRHKLVALQRALVQRRGMVMEGRDIGTVVFPEAPLKIFLKADPTERARRRLGQERDEGRETTLEETAREITRRDQSDAERTVSPLVAAPDACEIDSTHLTADQVVDRIMEFARERLIPE